VGSTPPEAHEQRAEEREVAGEKGVAVARRKGHE